MKHLMLMLLAIAGLEGCTTAKYGNFTSHTPYELNITLVTDTVHQLESLYPPASTQINIAQAIAKTDTFGNDLITTLRNHGYAVQEYLEKQPLPDEGLGLRYIIDVPAISTQKLYRIQLMVGADTLTRAYVAQNDTVIPAGSWARREDQ